MKPRSYLSKEAHTILAAGAALCLAAATAANAAVILNPTLGSVIDPAGGAAVDQEASGSTAMATLNARSDLKVIQDWDGWTRNDAVSAAGQIISFTATTHPDIRFKLTGTYASDAANPHDLTTVQGTSASVSSADSFILRSTAGAANILTIDFGDWNGSTFDTSANSILAAGFTISANTATESYSVVFFNGATALSTQTATGGGTSLADIYFGYQSSSANIDRIEIQRTNSSGALRSYFDDMAFTTVIPEPNAAALLGSLGTLLLLRRRRS